MRTDRGPVRRRRTYEAGHVAERIALLWLSLKGYRLLARRYAVRGGEIDLILRRGSTIAFVEVKARPTFADAASAVSPAKVQRIGRAAAIWLARNPWAYGMVLRGDLVAISPWRLPRHLPNALSLQSGNRSQKHRSQPIDLNAHNADIH